MLTKIVAGIDQTPGSHDAAALASALARASGADLLLVAAYQDPLLPFPPGLNRSDRVHEARQLLADVRPTLAPEGHTRCVPDYSAGHALRRTVRDERADLVVLGSSRQAPAGHVRAGRTGRQVLHDAPCAVAFAAAGIHERPSPLRRIVVGIDDTPEAEAALTLARELGRRAGAEVVAVGVVDDRLPVEAAPFGEIIELSRWGEVIEARRRHVQHRLDDLLGPAAGAEVVVDVRVGSPAPELAAAADGADLLIVGSRRWGVAERIALGSTVEELTHGARCSLLVLPRVAAESGSAPDRGARRGQGAGVPSGS
ncbi:MAG TPA: universal stress protein [Baekduia sp.]|nr:universal stress protein [Baekduia sp.]